MHGACSDGLCASLVQNIQGAKHAMAIRLCMHQQLVTLQLMLLQTRIRISCFLCLLQGERSFTNMQNDSHKAEVTSFPASLYRVRSALP